MKRSALLLIACLLLGSVSFAQQNPADAPASKADIEKYLDVLAYTGLDEDDDGRYVEADASRMIAEQLEEGPGDDAEQMEARVNKMMDDIIEEHANR